MEGRRGTDEGVLCCPAMLHRPLDRDHESKPGGEKREKSEATTDISTEKPTANRFRVSSRLLRDQKQEKLLRKAMQTSLSTLWFQVNTMFLNDSTMTFYSYYT